MSVAVLGGGAWGTALAISAHRAGNSVRLWARDAAIVEAIRSRGENPRYLAGIAIDRAINATTDLAEALSGAEIVLSVVPAQALRSVLPLLKPHVPRGVPVVLCAKGIERTTGKRLSAVAEELLPDHAIA
ncbi:MAG: 2-dehydropantoate 2-reductase N-terminal domain-containing protein, partial [Rhizobiaceae bacterium]